MAAMPLFPSALDHTGRDLGEAELSLLAEVIASGTLTAMHGQQVHAFEAAFGGRLGVPHARAVSSGTAAVHAAVAAVDPEPGDEIITTPLTDMGAITPILFQQAIPIFADVDPTTLNVTPESVAARVTSRTRAVIVTHMLGSPCDVQGIRRLVRGIPVIEDCAQALLASVDGRAVGTIGDIGAFSLQQGKHMTTGEGGVITTSDPARARHMRLFADKGQPMGESAYEFLALNYRMTELQGAVARAQLLKVDDVVARRRRNAAILNERLHALPGLTVPAARPGATHVYWRYALAVDPAAIRGGADALRVALEDAGVPCLARTVWRPAFVHRIFTERKTYGRSGCPYTCRVREGGRPVVYDPDEFPGTMRALRNVIVLHWNEHYTTEHVDHIARAVEAGVAHLAH